MAALADQSKIKFNVLLFTFVALVPFVNPVAEKD